jgi:Fusaric acid resistance protein-like
LRCVTLRMRIERLRAASLTLVQASLAAGLAWFVATEVVGAQRPFFAPIAAILTLGLAGGRRGFRAFEVGVGVTLGIAVADGLVNLIGSGTWQLVVVALLAMSAAVLLGGTPGVVGQTGVSAVFVVILEQPEGFDFTRTAHAAIGVASALLMSFVILPLDPLRLVRGAGGPALRELAGTLDDIAGALAARDRAAAHRALLRARAAEPLAHDFAEALVSARETAVASLPRRRALGAVEAYAAAGAQLDLAVRNVRVLARGAVRAVEVGDNVPPGACEALRELAAAVRALEPWLRDPGAVETVRHHATEAARRASAVLDQTANLSVSVIVGGVRSTAVDLLRGTGMERDLAVRLVRKG